MPPSAIDPPTHITISTQTRKPATSPISQNSTKKPTPPAITRELSHFILTLTYTSIPTPVLSHIKTLLLDYIGVSTFGSSLTESSTPFYNAIRTINGEYGTSTVFSHGSNFQPQYAMLLNGAYSHSLDFDDTHLPGVVHPGVTVISAALVEGERLRSSGKQLLVAIISGYEVVCRLGLALGSGGFAKGFHNTSTCGIFGAIAAIASLRGLSEEMVEIAFGVGISKTAGCMQYLSNGGWNKRLHPGFAAHDAFLCIGLAEAGILAAAQAIEGDHGFLELFGENSKSEDILQGLGSIWKCAETAIKPYPACRLTHGAIDLASSFHATANQKIQAITISISPLSYKIVGVPLPSKIHPINAVDAQFSIYYQTSATILHGSSLGWEVYSHSHLNSPQISLLSSKIIVLEDKELSDLQTRMTIRYDDGSEEMKFCQAPVGEVSNPLSVDKIRGKYLSLVEPVFGSERAEEIEVYVDGIEDRGVRGLMSLLG